MNIGDLVKVHWGNCAYEGEEDVELLDDGVELEEEHVLLHGELEELDAAKRTTATAEAKVDVLDAKLRVEKIFEPPAPAAPSPAWPPASPATPPSASPSASPASAAGVCGSSRAGRRCTCTSWRR